MRNRNVVRSLLWCLTIGWMILIYSLSNQPAIQSSKLSGGVVNRIVEKTMPTYDGMGKKVQLTIFDRYQFVVRKFAHGALYFMLGVLVMAVLMTYRFKRAFQHLLSLCICFIYAITDEIHQLFIPGRAGLISDICIDLLGAVIGVFFLVLSLKVIDKWRNNYSNNTGIQGG